MLLLSLSFEDCVTCRTFLCVLLSKLYLGRFRPPLICMSVMHGTLRFRLTRTTDSRLSLLSSSFSIRHFQLPVLLLSTSSSSPGDETLPTRPCFLRSVRSNFLCLRRLPGFLAPNSRLLWPPGGRPILRFFCPKLYAVTRKQWSQTLQSLGNKVLQVLTKIMVW